MLLYRPFVLLCLLLVQFDHTLGFPDLWNAKSLGFRRSQANHAHMRRDKLEYNPDGTPFLWLPHDEYSGKTFFDRWQFFSERDPTNGHVNYVNKTAAFESGLVYVENDGKVIMTADMTSRLPRGQFRDSVRIESLATYTTGLFILDLNTAPWGCAVWPAFWTVGGDWPWNGEIDIIEGVHDNEHNQVAWHTAPGCHLNSNASFTGTISSSGGASHTDCNSFINSNSGCGVTEWSRASYGPYFDEQGGGIFAMKWDENDISIWSFYRAAVPKDVTEGAPNPAGWGAPSARLDNTGCNITQFFNAHRIVFGDWAGNSYATSGCPGSCEDRLMEPKNFENASWSINSLKVYRKQVEVAKRGTLLFRKLDVIRLEFLH
ncbi:glycoside hydrolase family 16 protein [Agrocybe pediades]|nr:glycoside hydrolase family 16 protein [Agrocybe pediades]